jgi:hypothetical protein
MQKRKEIMKKPTMTAVAVASLILAGCGQKETIREVLVTTPPTEAPAAPEASKYDQYLEMLYNESAQARAWEESELLELGTTVCEVFEQGGTVDGLIGIFNENSKGKYDDEFYAAVLASSVYYLCPEWMDYVQSQLN